VRWHLEEGVLCAAETTLLPLLLAAKAGAGLMIRQLHVHWARQAAGGGQQQVVLQLVT